MHAPTLSPEKSQDKERSDDIINKLGNKDKNHVDQPTDIVNIEELDSDDIPIGQRLAPGISKRLNSWKGQVVGSSSTPSKYVRKKANVGPTIRWSNVVTPTPKRKFLLNLVNLIRMSNTMFRTSSPLPESKLLGRRFHPTFMKFHLTTSLFTMLKMLKNGNMFIK